MLLHKVYDREKLTYGSARDPMKIGVKQPAKKKETHTGMVTHEPRLAAKEGF